MTLDEWLRQKFPTAKQTTLRRMVSEGRVLVGGQPARVFRQLIADGDAVELLDDRTSRNVKSGVREHPGSAPQDQPWARIFEDADVLVVAKPHGLLTSTNSRERRPTLLAMVERDVSSRESAARVGLIHRLDRDAAGLLVFSKNPRSYRSLKTQFFHHSVDRVYHAVVHGTPDPPSDRVESRLVERADGTVHSTRQAGRGEPAVTEYQVIRSAGKRSLVQVTLHTGRKHQIRVHLGERNHPIVGDQVYARGVTADVPLMLMATRLAFDHPRSGQRCSFELPLPQTWTV